MGHTQLRAGGVNARERNSRSEEIKAGVRKTPISGGSIPLCFLIRFSCSTVSFLMTHISIISWGSEQGGRYQHVIKHVIS